MNAFGVLLLLFVVLPIVGYVALWIRRAQRISDAFDPDVQRHAGPEQPSSRRGHSQIAGEECESCAKTIVFEDDGTLCSRCGDLFHVGCLRSHRCV